MGGYVAKKLGDGLMALFGYPIAQENDSERVARAALGIHLALGELNRKNAGSGKPEFNARIGLEAGPVVVDAAGEIFGDAPNVAARVQALAEPGAVLITARVQRQIAGLFVAEESVCRAPAQIKNAYRLRLESEPGWHPIDAKSRGGCLAAGERNAQNPVPSLFLNGPPRSLAFAEIS
jgi:class 3 adenylate cyclase